MSTGTRYFFNLLTTFGAVNDFETAEFPSLREARAKAFFGRLPL
ncbi:hypothetical protein [Rhizobium leguminosarum]|nr:hypothetical protein [Rhizobium leguminosarum]